LPLPSFPVQFARPGPASPPERMLLVSCEDRLLYRPTDA
jgi:hypothetical protein